MHLMRWQQLFPQIFLCSYPFPVHLKSIFIAGASWKVVQGKTKLTLLTCVRSEEDDPLEPTSLDIHLLYYLLRDFFHTFLSSDALLLKSGTQAQHKGSSFGPHNIYIYILIEKGEKKSNQILIGFSILNFVSSELLGVKIKESKFN